MANYDDDKKADENSKLPLLLTLFICSAIAIGCLVVFGPKSETTLITDDVVEEVAKEAIKEAL